MATPQELAPARFFDARRVTVPASGTFPIRYDFQPDVIKFLAYSSIDNRIEIVLSGAQGGGSIPIFGRGPVDVPGISENQEILLRNLDTVNRDLLVIAMKGYLPVQLNTPEVTSTLPNPVVIACEVHRNTAQSVPNDAYTPVVFDEEHYDTDDMHDLVVNVTRITVNTAGLYAIKANIAWGLNATGERGLRIIRNFGDVLAEVFIAEIATGTTGVVLPLSADRDLVVDDIIEIEAFQNSGAPLDLLVRDNFAPLLSVFRVGPMV